ncbi:restriction endonuclease [Domibacillus aminovorans]|uniref:Restriction endonuclease n=1 Tax=Domibacillus aminovorans TaxID=29332 RepID=A0A177KS51_9BACI|nr:HNH endonuclease [Domibacillus aminovorans]OAH55785.1 restriction endonuclease [Domibacillus aminovorans]
MDEKVLLQKINNMSIWKKRDQRAPHKPLLILYALGRLQQDQVKYIPYVDVREKLEELLIAFGPIRKSYHPEQPFVRLKNDGIWELDMPVDQNFTNKKLMANNVSGGFTEEVFDLLLKNDHLIQEVANIVLNTHFPESIHEDILQAAGLDFSFIKTKSRDPKFREKILRAYSYSCAVCGFNVRLGHTLVAVEAAHIKWHQAGGPDHEENGIALCSLHHKLFDRGVFTLSDSGLFIVSEDAHGTHGLNEWLMQFHGKAVREPIHAIYEPNKCYLDWHVREVFRGPARYTLN